MTEEFVRQTLAHIPNRDVVTVIEYLIQKSKEQQQEIMRLKKEVQELKRPVNNQQPIMRPL